MTYKLECPYERARENSDGETLIVGNGSKWAGSSEASIEKLYEILDNYDLCPMLYKHTLYTGAPWRLIGNDLGWLEEWRNAPSYIGNFFTYSHGFNIITKDDELVKTLEAKLAENVKRQMFVKEAEELYENHFVVRDRHGDFALVNAYMAHAMLHSKAELTGHKALYKGGLSQVYGKWNTSILFEGIDAYIDTVSLRKVS